MRKPGEKAMPMGGKSQCSAVRSDGTHLPRLTRPRRGLRIATETLCLRARGVRPIFRKMLTTFSDLGATDEERPRVGSLEAFAGDLDPSP
jgi:hypothetical protein